MNEEQMKALDAILEAAHFNELEQGSRLYLPSALYGDSVYHMLEKKSDGLQIEQIDIHEKWNKRVMVNNDQVPGLLKALIRWYVGAAQTKTADCDLGDLDEHPF